jgi:hypothetical protein
MSERDDRDELDELLNNRQQKQSLYCEEHFVTVDKAIKAFWAVLIIGLGLIGTGVGWALTTNTTISRHETVISQHDRDISSLQSIHSTMDTVVTLLRQMKNAKDVSK